MGQNIRILPEKLCNKIAAGEVVERPASVVKELIENALDAGADEILVDIEAGGRKLIRIRDNGSGMTRDDAFLSLERHATSKVSRDDDLFRLTTLGFRGEALPRLPPSPVLFCRQETTPLRKVSESGCQAAMLNIPKLWG